MKFGTVVIYKEFGQEFPALVVSSRELEHHAGENGEPLVNLVFVREVKNGAGEVINVSGSSREAEAVQFRHDVAHDSHAFSEEAKAELVRAGQLPPGGEVPGGRYVEAGYHDLEAKDENAAEPAAEVSEAPVSSEPAAAAQPAEASGDGDAQSAEPEKETVN